MERGQRKGFLARRRESRMRMELQHGLSGVCDLVQPRRLDSPTIDMEERRQRMIEQVPQTTRHSTEGRRPIVVLLVDDQRFVGAAVGQLLATVSDIELHCRYHAEYDIACYNQIIPLWVLNAL